MTSSPPSSNRDGTRPRRRYLRWLFGAVVVGVLVHWCQPSTRDSARARVTEAVAQRLGTRAELVELEWFEARSTEVGTDFEALARVSSSQPGDLHAERYEVHGRGRSASEAESPFEVETLQVTAIPHAPPEARP